MSRQRPLSAPSLGALAAGFGLSLLGSSVVAQTADGAVKKTDTPLPEVTVKGTKENASPAKQNYQAVTTTLGKGKQELRDIPQSISVMTEKLIDDVKLDTLKQALHYTAGITFAATENGTDQDIRLRGFPVASTGDLLLDGMRDPSQYDRDTFNYDRIEVMRGSASMIFGRGSTGGVINQVTKKPMLADQSDVVGTLGDRGYFRSTMDFNIRTGEEAALRINAMVTKADNGGAKINKQGIAPTYSWGIGTADEFTAGLFYLNTNNVPVSAIRWLGANGPTSNCTAAVMCSVPNVDAKNFYGMASDYVDGKASYGSLAHTHRFADGGELRSNLRTGTFERQQWSSVAGYQGGTTTGNLSDSTVLTRGGLNPRKDRYVGTYLQSDYSNKYQWLGMTHNILAGIDLSNEQADRYQNNAFLNALGTRPDTTVGTPDNGAALGGTGNSPLYRKTSDYSGTSAGAYAQNLLQVSPSWKLLGGLRWDRFSATTGQLTYGTNGAPTATPTATPISHLTYSSLWSYRAGALYQPTPTSSYHFSYSTSFNTAADTYQYTTQQNANTPAEKSRNIELGAKLDWLDGKLSTRAALFKTEKYNERTTDSDFAASAYTLSGQRHSEGLELDVVGRVTSALEVYVSYSYIWTAKIDKTGTSGAGLGSRVGLTPKNTGSAWLSYQLTPQIRVAGGVRGASQNRPLQGGSGAASVTSKAPGYVAGDIMAEYKFSPDLYTQVNVTNVTNKLYGDQLYPGFVILGEPRSFKWTVGMRF